MTLSPTSELSIDEAKKQISYFYRYLKPSATSLLKLIEHNKYSSEYPTLVSNQDDFIAKTIANNKLGDCFAARNRFTTKRLTENITFLKCFVIDIDDDINNQKSKKFEEICKANSIYIEAKARSREEGGYHYYIPYQQTIVNDSNRDSIIQISNNFKNWLVQENNLDIDQRIFDLPRLIRIWGTYNHKRKSYCKLLYFHSASQQHIQHNTDFINSLTAKTYPQIPTVSNLVTSCPLVEYVRLNKLEKEDTEKNDKLLKNVAIFLYNILKEDGVPIARDIAKLQQHNPSEVDGWFAKAKAGKLSQFSCGELRNWLKTHYEELLALTCNKCMLSNRNKICYTDGTETWHQLKKEAREQRRLLVNKSLLVKGMVTPSVAQNKQGVVIFKEFVNDNSEEIVPEKILIFLDEKAPKGSKWRECHTLSVDFYVYELKEKGVSYVLLSEKKLEYGEYYIHGNVVELTDQLLIGNYGKITAKKKLMFLNESKNVIEKIKTKEDLFKRTSNWNYNGYTDFLFNVRNEKLKKDFTYRQPDNVTQMITSFLFSTHDEYPMHLCFFGKQDSGKSTIIDAVLNKFNESYALVDGSNTTLKGIVPSFGGAVPKIGVILESTRICAIDEFFRIIKSEEDNNRISVLNNFLLHKEYSNKTGKGEINCQMRSKLFVVTNPLYGCNFEETINKLPPSTADRILIWKQTTEHYKWVGKGDNKLEKTSDIRKNDFIAVYDYMNSFLSEFDDKKIKLIVDEFKPKCPNYMLSLYETRYGNHHSLCLMDGIVKTRCLFDKDNSFKATDEDYESFRLLWNDLVVGWYDKVSQEEGERLISEEQKALFDIIKNNKDIWDYKLEKVCEEKNIEFKNNYKRLLELKMIENNNRKITIIEEQEVVFEDIGIE